MLDEFALILHLTDVYWSNEGRLSVDLISLAAAALGLALVGFSPLGVDDVGGAELVVRLTSTGVLAVHAVVILTCVLKGKYSLALFGIFVPFPRLDRRPAAGSPGLDLGAAALRTRSGGTGPPPRR